VGELPILKAWTLFGLGHVQLIQGDLPRARSYFEACLGISTQLGVPWSIAWGQFSLGLVAFLDGQLLEADRLARESLVLRSTMRDLRTLPDSFDLLAGVAVASGQPDRAAQLFGAATGARDRAGIAVAPTQRILAEPGVAKLRGTLGNDGFERGYRTGRLLSLEHAIAFALAHAPAEQTAEELRPQLSPRELEVARLVAAGLTNHAIAATLVLSVRTVETHISRARQRLGLASRAQLAVWAARQGLLDETIRPV
jgi:non-specific serine/threonine protein kinase